MYRKNMQEHYQQLFFAKEKEIAALYVKIQNYTDRMMEQVIHENAFHAPKLAGAGFTHILNGRLASDPKISEWQGTIDRRIAEATMYAAAAAAFREEGAQNA